jgi:hypothetical protein
MLLVLVLVACGRSPPLPESPTSAPAPAVGAAPAGVTAPVPQPELCAALTELLAAESTGFAELRGTPQGIESWIGQMTVPGTKQCTIEGDAWPRARYECVGQPVAAGQRDRVASQFDLLSGQIDACLAKPTWFPRTWQKNAPFTFAMDERQQTWTDRSTLPPSAVVLRMQRGASGDVYRVRVDLTTIR